MTATTPSVRQVHALRVADIVVKDGRQRTEMGDLEGLASSIITFGLLQPIIVTRENVLIAGERRLEAHRMNGAATIDALYRDELDELDLEQIELEENVRRKQLTWQEEQKAIARIHQIQQKRNPKWSQAETAAMIKHPDNTVQQRDVSEAIVLNKMMALFPEIADAKSKAQAINMARAKAKSVTRRLDVKAKPEVYAEIEEKIILGDSVEVIKTVPDGVIDAHITDPPFGIDYGERVAGTVGAANSYKDDVEKYMNILTMIPDLYRTLKPDGWVVWFLGISWYEHVKKEFRKAGFVVDEVPIIWDRSDGRCFTNVPRHYFAKAYDIALHAFKGDPHIVKKGKNIIRVKPVDQAEREFVVERPVELYQELISRLTIPGQLVADWFAGSGSCPAAAVSLKRDFIACEQDADRRAGAIQKIKSFTPS